MRILYISARFPYPPINGSRQRIYHFLQALTKEHQVHLISFVKDEELVEQDALNQLGINSQLVPSKEFKPGRGKALLGFFSSTPRALFDTYSTEMKNTIHYQVGRFKPDLIIFSDTFTSIYGPIEPAPCIIDDMESSTIKDKWKNAASFPLRSRYWMSWKKHSKYIRRTLMGIAGCVVASETEKLLLHEISPDYSEVHVIPNGVDIEYNVPANSQQIPGKLIYNGSLTYFANYDAIEYFLSRIMSYIEDEMEVHLTITGSTYGVDINRLPKNHKIEFTGYLPDIRPAIHSSMVCIVPLRIGGGTRLKILEAMALGVPVVSTPKGAEGLDLTPEQDILIGEDDISFADQVVRLLKDESLRATLSANGRKIVEAFYDWRNIGEDYLKIVEQIACQSKK